MTDQQAQELADLEEAVQSDYQDRKVKLALAVQKAAEADTARAAQAMAETEAEAAAARLVADLARMKDFVDRLIDPVVGIEVVPGVPTARN